MRLCSTAAVVPADLQPLFRNTPGNNAWHWKPIPTSAAADRPILSLLPPLTNSLTTPTDLNTLKIKEISNTNLSLPLPLSLTPTTTTKPANHHILPNPTKPPHRPKWPPPTPQPPKTPAS